MILSLVSAPARPTVLTFPLLITLLPASLHPSASPDLMEVLRRRRKAANVFEHGPEGESIKMAHASDDKTNELCDESSMTEKTMSGVGC